jgi:peptidoglycan hydrolase-like protein with peptidoglycan-binding domain
MRGSPLNYLGAPILSLQSMLAVLSKAGGELPSVIPDGVYGPETTRAVSAFQRQNGLPENGETDNRTWNHIVDAFTRLSPLVLPAASLSIVCRPSPTAKKTCSFRLFRECLSPSAESSRICRSCA